MTIAELEQKIIDASQAYYSGEPIMHDKEFDGLIEYLRAANPSSNLLTSVGWGYDPFKQVGEKENHLYGKVEGIDKKPKTIEDIPNDFYNTKISLSAKLDGLSMVCYFINGKFVKALTRGNGVTGINRTDKVQKIIENELNIPEGFDFTGAIRGEICISNDNWKIMQEKNIAGSNQRNTATGIINRDEILEDIQYLDLIFYKVIGFKNDMTLKYNAIYKENIIDGQNYDVKFLRKFIKPEYIVDYELNDGSLINQNDLEILFERFKSKYLCDGIVITKDNRNIESVSTKYVNNFIVHNDEIAYKFITETAITKIENIRWKMSKGNKAIPVINVTPVELSGAIVSNATAFNAKYIYDNDLDIGSEVELVRSGEVIPYITSVIKGSNGAARFKLDEMTCPYCNSKLEWVGVDLVCNNPECANRDEKNLKTWVSNIAQVDGISEVLIFKFFDELNITSLDELYSKSYDELKYVDASDNSHKGKFNQVLDKLFNQPITFKNLLVALNIKSLGIKSAEKLASTEEFIAIFNEFLEVQNMELFINEGKKISQSLVGPALTDIMFNTADGLTKFKNTIKVKDRINFEVEEKMELIPVVITGKLSTPRKEFEVYLKENGYEVKGSITSDIKYLITDNPNSNSSKNKNADKLGITKISEEEIRKIIDDSFKYSSKNIL